MQYARDNGYIVLTHDLDFSAILAATGAKAPSVIQVRAQDVLSERFEKLVINALHQFESVLASGALVVIDDSGSNKVAARSQAVRRADFFGLCAAFWALT